MKNLLNLGKALNKAEQKAIIGGEYIPLIKECEPDCECLNDADCGYFTPPPNTQYRQGTCRWGTCVY